MSASVEVVAAGALTTVQDHGRIGYAHLGVPRAGALDRPAADLANRLVGNATGAAVLESTLGGLVLRGSAPRWAAVTGAVVELRLEGRAVPHGEAFYWDGGELRLGTPARGVRSYLAVAGGFDAEPVLGSRSTDTLGELGPRPLQAGDRLRLGPAPATGPAALDVPPARRCDGLRVAPGPRADWFADDALTVLRTTQWRALPASDRVALRLDGPPLPRVRAGESAAELASEGLVLGAVQVPPDGRPIVFLADHPTTGGYPVIAVVDPADLWQCAQARPGDPVRFR